MGEVAPNQKKISTAEKAATLYRNLNILGAAALRGIGILVPPVAPATTVLAGIDILQAAGGEVVRRGSQKRRTKRVK